ncbi:MAG TPA: hypothetical protein VG142_14380 [Trebonia sp.]|jgi:hypothetical protein|nr:hypothetical protein [Trebonia sp.]
MPRLIDVVASLESADPESTIYATRPATPDSSAILAVEPESGESPEGFPYLLEVDIALEVLDIWARWREGRQPTPQEAVRAVIHYAIYDAYEPV